MISSHHLLCVLSIYNVACFYLIILYFFPQMNKRVAVEVDRLSDLPINVINLIQEYVHLDAAARMSILSSKWRYIWASHPKLLIYEHFSRNRNQSGIIHVINKILSNHSFGEPIKTFFLDIIPIHFSDHSLLDQWMLFLSKNGLLELTLKNNNNVNAPYKLPLCVYSIVLLQQLYLSNCILQPPSCNFRRLENISLTDVIFDLDNESSSCFVLCLPILKKLSFVRCRGLYPLNIHAPQLVSFSMSGRGSGTFNLHSILKCQKLDELIYYPQEEVSQNDEMINMPQLPIIFPKIRHFVFDRYSLKFMASGIVAKWLPRSFKTLNILHLCDLDLNNTEQMRYLVYLLTSCPNLSELCTVIDCTKSNGLKASLSEIQRCKNIKELNNLEILNLKEFQGSLEEYWFVMSVRASTPLLKKIIVSFHSGVDEEKASRIYQWLISLTMLPGSPLNKPQIICEPLEKI
ncbi:hypothetical protein RDI58_000635 [Solanum bulbocastanum]|uniref:At1g61320/AtMIF1 LRR domain-containing protein n=1 Tax=Solanum bulbocastanum TaxID=147425 RepID=A0AAN8UCS2_SOLBU